MMEALRYVDDYYVGQVLEIRQIEPLGVCTERFEACEEVKYGLVVVSTNEGERCSKD